MQLYYDCFSHRLQQSAVKGVLDWLPVGVLLAVVTTGPGETVVGLGLAEIAVVKTGQKTNTKTPNKQKTPPRDREKI